jgi:hypothetical protein
MFQVDMTTGMVESSGFDITFPNGLAFGFLLSSGQAGTLWEIQGAVDDDLLDLEFTTAPTPGSLVGFTGGKIVGNNVIAVGIPEALYGSISGSITPAPEPSSLLLLAGGIGWLVFGLTRRFGKKSAIH